MTICPKCHQGRLHGETIFAGGSSLARECSESNAANVEKCWACGYLRFSNPLSVAAAMRSIDVKPRTRAEQPRGKASGDINLAAVNANLNELKFWSLNGDSIAVCNRKLKAKGVDMSDNTLRRYLCKIAELQEAA